MKNLKEILEIAQKSLSPKICVASAHDEDVLKSVWEAKKHNVCEAILVGNKEQIDEICKKNDIDLDLFEVIDEKDPAIAAKLAVKLVSEGSADILMKGNVQTSVLLKEVLNKEYGLRTGEILSHIAVTSSPLYNRLVFVSDGGVNIAPDLKKKVSILKNTVNVARLLGVDCPKVAVLSAIETVNPDMQSSVDAHILAGMAIDGMFGDCIVEGPVAMDIAVSQSAAKHKGFASKIAGETDVFIVPSIECGNIMCKSLIYLGGCDNGGVIAGAKNPIVLTSRSDTYENKLYSIAIAAVMAQNMKN